ncbi:unnamed protein product [Camellia sinensis]
MMSPYVLKTLSTNQKAEGDDDDAEADDDETDKDADIIEESAHVGFLCTFNCLKISIPQRIHFDISCLLLCICRMSCREGEHRCGFLLTIHSLEISEFFSCLVYL